MHKEISLVIRGSMRRKVLENLHNPTTPTLLAKKIDSNRPSVSRAILALREAGLVTCLNHEEKRGRLYKISDKGKKVLEEIRKIE